ncbi:DUF6602 domain-containing protein [Mariniflexile litorale]|uniref:DUF6602 domain-containing protein n=1 Tax=Mariniflexile litorale TaxID=3045158 RepID=A0AAU7EF60_9FLAO|nr:DUF6602 domain-containing protein [Mariniflexile sp. KMM 9835]MDQ8213568.1 hypothetical protein [Mariniflexile sp. KMM 9835]
MTEPIFKEEEKAILLSVDKAKASSNNSQVIGRNGELPLLTFLNNYLPPNLKAVSGHFLTPESIKSPQIDIIIIDSRYPLLGYNDDGTVLVMAHSVLRIIEIKTNLTTKDLKKTAIIFSKTKPLFNTIWKRDQSGFDKPVFELLAYRLTVKERTIENSYFENCNPADNHFDVSILRSEELQDYGIQLHFEPTSQWNEFKEVTKDILKDKFLLTCFKQRTPLADFYYQLIQDSYYTIHHRNYSLKDIGEHFMEYLNWTTTRR